MGKLRCTGQLVRNLPPRALVGRSHLANIRVDHDEVSGEHAVIEWRSEGWQVRDLASTNGTLVNGQPLAPGTPHLLSSGDRITFGRSGDSWFLEDDGEPEMFARRVADGRELRGHAGLLALPSEENPAAQIMLAGADEWKCVTATTDMPLEDRQHIEVEGEQWQVVLPIGYEETRRLNAESPTIKQMALCFQVSQDEENVAIEVTDPRAASPRVIEPRAHNYVLLHLARLRLQDVALGQNEQGWVSRVDLARDLRIDPTHLNVQIFRVRRSFADVGVADVGNLVEVRGRPGQLRIGVEKLRIAPLG